MKKILGKHWTTRIENQLIRETLQIFPSQTLNQLQEQLTRETVTIVSHYQSFRVHVTEELLQKIAFNLTLQQNKNKSTF